MYKIQHIDAFMLNFQCIFNKQLWIDLRYSNYSFLLLNVFLLIFGHQSHLLLDIQKPASGNNELAGNLFSLQELSLRLLGIHRIGLHETQRGPS